MLRTREHVACLRPRGDLLALQLMRYHHELRSPEQLASPSLDLSASALPESELSLAAQLVEALGARWRPEKHRDVFHEEVEALIRKRIEAGETRIAGEAVAQPKGEVIDIATLLERSLERARGEDDQASRSTA